MQPRQFLITDDSDHKTQRVPERSAHRAPHLNQSTTDLQRSRDKPVQHDGSVHLQRDCVLSAAHTILALAQGLFQPLDSTPPRVVTFTGVERHNGCTWVCGMVAEALAVVGGGKVCIVDANMRFPSVSRMFGLTDDVAGAEKPWEVRPVIGKRAHRNLWAVTAGTAQRDPSAVLASADFKGVLSELAESFDHVLIDTPALGQYPDALQLRWISNGIVLVLEADSTKRDLAAGVKQTLSVSQIPILAAVLNRFLVKR
jgi:protein-tyrosine kinase